jgi:hypothetical protein
MADIWNLYNSTSRRISFRKGAALHLLHKFREVSVILPGSVLLYEALTLATDSKAYEFWPSPLWWYRPCLSLGGRRHKNFVE